MSAPAAVITHGASGAILLSEEITRRVNDFDDGILEYLCPEDDTYEEGEATPDYPSMRIQEATARPEADEWILRLRVRGLMSGSARRTRLLWNEDSTGWDEAEEERILKNGTSPLWASTLPGYGNMRLMSLGEEAAIDSVYSRRTGRYRGIRRAGLASREVSVNDNIVQPGEPIQVLLTGGWPGEYRDANVSFPRVRLRERVKMLARPNTAVVPKGNLTVPISGVAFPPVQLIEISSPSGVKSNWPWDWKYVDVAYEQLAANIPLYLATWEYEYVPQYQF